MKPTLITLLALLFTAGWLVMLVETGFNAITVSAGLLGALYVEGRSTES